jgi:hypothetical protein
MATLRNIPGLMAITFALTAGARKRCTVKFPSENGKKRQIRGINSAGNF